MKPEYDIINLFATKKILVIGDLIWDVYLKGTSSRLSPEAPVPVVDIHDRIEQAGGAANTAVNLRALGADVMFLSVCGADDEGKRARSVLDRAGIDTSAVMESVDRKTIVKTRVLIGAHTQTRFDSGTVDAVDGDLENKMIDRLQQIYPACDAVILSDYNKGVITSRLLGALQNLQKQRCVFIAADSKRLEFFKDLHPAFVKPNYEEALSLVGFAKKENGRMTQIQCIGSALFEITGAQLTVVTLDKEGAALFDKNNFLQHVHTPEVQSPRVAGAGDTFMAAFVLASICGAPSTVAANLACTAASIAIKKEGTATCATTELKAFFTADEKVIHAMATLESLCDFYRLEGKRIVFTNGCFDILHSGHVSYLNRAKHLGDVLIVGVNTDESIRRLKGEKRPINPLRDRLEVLSGLSAVNHVIAFGSESDDTPIGLIRIVRPNVFVKGGDYSRDKLPEAETVEQYGGEIVFLSLVPDHSTSNIIRQIHTSTSLVTS